MTSEVDDSKSVGAQIIEPGSIAHTLDTLHLRLALQSSPRRWLPGISALLKTIEHGGSFEDAVKQGVGRMPRDLASLAQASLNLPDPTRFLLDSMAAPQETAFVRWQLRLLFAYPLVMLLLTAGICAVVCAALEIMMIEGFEDFGLTGFGQAINHVKDQRAAQFALLSILVWCAVVWITIGMIGPAWSRIAILGGLPILGKPLRWIGLYELLSRYSIVGQQTIDSVTASQIVGQSYHGSEFEVVADLAARRILAGKQLGSAMKQSMLSDGLISPALLSIDYATDQSRACEKVAATIKSMAESRCRVIGGIMPPLLMIMIGTMIWGTISGYFSGLIILMRMITSLA